MLVCIQCAMRAILDGNPPPRFENEDPIAHMREFHPDPVATQREREEMERELHKRFENAGMAGGN
jgi:hypothetical protein